MNHPAASDRRAWIVGAVVAAIVLGGAGFVLYRELALVWAVPSTSTKIPPTKGSTLPADLRGRVGLLAECLLTDDLPTLRRLTIPTARENCRAWLEEANKAFAGVKGTADLETKIPLEDRHTGGATAVVIKAKTRRGLVLLWRLQPDQTWLFDPGDEPAVLRLISD